MVAGLQRDAVVGIGRVAPSAATEEPVAGGSATGQANFISRTKARTHARKQARTRAHV